jgi:hypothetical protein
MTEWKLSKLYRTPCQFYARTAPEHSIAWQWWRSSRYWPLCQAVSRPDQPETENLEEQREEALKEGT